MQLCISAVFDVKVYKIQHMGDSILYLTQILIITNLKSECECTYNEKFQYLFLCITRIGKGFEVVLVNICNRLYVQI